MVENVAHQPLDDDLQDLCQMVYLILLEYDEAKVVDLWEHGELGFFLARIIVNQFRSSNSPFHYMFRKPRERGYGLDKVAETAEGFTIAGQEAGNDDE